ncbi:MAG: FAD-binding oxidoreductase [Bacteriovoracaceae bacterium]|nr:FAD-binding oxidoreductase [Bacteriovoracaceae bacterium]
MSISLPAFLKSHQIKTDPSDIEKYARDWTRVHTPNSPAILFPETTEEVQKIVLWARKEKIALVPSGGRTGLSAGAVAFQGEVVISLERMDKIIELNEINRTLRCEAGLITEKLQNAVEEADYFFPVDLASRGSSQIGGNIATNAGGTKVIRYGHIRNWVRHLKVVTGSGEILNLHRGLVKDNSGYDLKHLFIASEGTLGIITEATLEFTIAPQNLTVVLLACEHLDSALEILVQFRKTVDLTAFEFFTDKALHYVLKSTNLEPPFSKASSIYILLEFENRNSAVMDAVLETFDTCLVEGLVTDGVVSQNSKQASDFWKYRENISESLSKYNPYKNDISVAISKIPQFVREVGKIYEGVEVVWFGHIGDGNLHINVIKSEKTSAEDFAKMRHDLGIKLFTIIEKFNGSISAEHGIGLLKKPYLHFGRSVEEIQLMRQIKKIFDPDLILNPGKIFDESE